MQSDVSLDYQKCCLPGVANNMGARQCMQCSPRTWRILFLTGFPQGSAGWSFHFRRPSIWCGCASMVFAKESVKVGIWFSDNTAQWQ